MPSAIKGSTTQSWHFLPPHLCHFPAFHCCIVRCFWSPPAPVLIRPAIYNWHARMLPRPKLHPASRWSFCPRNRRRRHSIPMPRYYDRHCPAPPTAHLQRHHPNGLGARNHHRALNRRPLRRTQHLALGLLHQLPLLRHRTRNGTASRAPARRTRKPQGTPPLRRLYRGCAVHREHVQLPNRHDLGRGAVCVGQLANASADRARCQRHNRNTVLGAVRRAQPLYPAVVVQKPLRHRSVCLRNPAGPAS